MREQSKAAKRRFSIGAFHSRYFVGNGLDIGAGNDGLDLYASVFRGIRAVQLWDQPQGDAQHLASIEGSSFDFVHSSHCLEHMVDVKSALANWLRVLKRGGYLIVTVPDEDMYEQGIWPSNFNSDHKHTFTICKTSSWSPVSINIVDLITSFASQIDVEHVARISDFYNNIPGQRDQTLLPNVESAIEFIWKKK